ncbi:MAG: MBL fold metallo-hydrolase [Desulfobacterales bacterium]|jgi:glyoxylase-like metal-dependent hydrolase (beta-lactamase superfamily II)
MRNINILQGPTKTGSFGPDIHPNDTFHYILNTHGHSDHVLGNPKLKEVLNVPVCMHEVDDRFFFGPDGP